MLWSGAGPVPLNVARIDWSSWSGERATLLFVRREAEVLLIKKKRGLGAGKINAPGGRLEPGESPRECAVREVEEELRVQPRDVRWWGEHRFQFVDGYRLHVDVFTADSHLGVAEETEEAVPRWTAVDRIPFERMWADDRFWIPHLLGRRRFSGRWIFDGDAMLDYALVVGDRAPWGPASLA